MSSTGRPIYVAVCGAGVANEYETALAETVGRLLARAGAVLVCGGLGGVMAAAAHGAALENGTSIGILPGSARGDEAPELTYSIPTGMGEGRNVLVVRAADALIAIGGEFGTLSEIALGLKIGIPVIGLDTWELAKPGKAVDAVRRETTPEAAVQRALEAAERGRRR
jgi:uncharacterized protein (TIGR00725 family)